VLVGAEEATRQNISASDSLDRGPEDSGSGDLGGRRTSESGLTFLGAVLKIFNYEGYRLC